RANRLARFLLARGAAPETIVALSMERTPDVAMALLAVLKAGATALPISPDLPPERHAAILADARPLLVLSNATLAEAHDEIEAHDSTDLPDIAAPWNAAYVVYTSGSTGTPKGVVVTYRSLV